MIQVLKPDFRTTKASGQGGCLAIIRPDSPLLRPALGSRDPKSKGLILYATFGPQPVHARLVDPGLWLDG